MVIWDSIFTHHSKGPLLTLRSFRPIRSGLGFTKLLEVQGLWDASFGIGFRV